MRSDSKDGYMSIPVMETQLVCVLLAVISGSLNGFSFIRDHLFSTVQSANIFLVGQTIATQNWHHLVQVISAIAAFLIGVAVSTWIISIGQRKNRVYSGEILFVEAAFLIVLGITTVNEWFSPFVACLFISFLAGMQGNAFHIIDGMLYGNIAVTFVVQLAGHYAMLSCMGDRQSRQKARKDLWLFSSVLLGFAFGGLVGTLLVTHFGTHALWFTAVVLICLCLYFRGIHY